MKSYLNYLEMGRLSQWVKSLGLTIADQKLKAIYFLIYPDTLRALEYCLDLIRYLQSFRHFYA